MSNIATDPFYMYEQKDYETHREMFKLKENALINQARIKDKLTHIDSLLGLCISAMKDTASIEAFNVLSCLANYIKPELKQVLEELENQ